VIPVATAIAASQPCSACRPSTIRRSPPSKESGSWRLFRALARARARIMSGFSLTASAASARARLIDCMVRAAVRGWVTLRRDSAQWILAPLVGRL